MRISILDLIRFLFSDFVSKEHFSMTISDLKTDAAAISKAASDAIARVAEDVAELKRKIDEGGQVDQADLQAISATLQATATALNAVDPDPAFPPTA